jgi:DNA-binding HxlR family transcriptional regulator
VQDASQTAEWKRLPLIDPLKKLLAAYLVKMNDVRRRELRLARLEDLREITPNFNTLKKNLGKLESKGYIEDRPEKREHHYAKTRKGDRMEEILLDIWPYINDMDADWRGKIES